MNLEIDLGLDSLARAETFAALEQAFSTEFEGDEAATALTVANVIELVNKHGGKDVDNVSLDLNWGKIVREADDDFPEVRGILQDRPLFSVFTFLVYKVFHLFFRVFMLLDVKGRENLVALSKLNENKRLDKTFLICPNHQSFLDPFVLCSNYPYALFKNAFHVGASEFFEGSFLKFVAKMLNVVPVNPDTELMRAMKAGAIGLKNGKVLNIYPEGERGFDGELHAFKKGAAILATELDLPIVPVALDGLHRVWPRKSWRIRPAKVKITIGKPFYAKDILAGHSELSGDEQYALVTAHLKEAISDMIEKMRAENARSE
ncbi:MAG: 1-acyl-sn-glycerol-3-phosphate acyltransferase [Acidobacteria bacterium]|nr:1-acyl-sn-glycerol-3-phosphate acyltransferase [Acidobacteriota bacterium]